jgi:hypothetical protein
MPSGTPLKEKSEIIRYELDHFALSNKPLHCFLWDILTADTTPHPRLNVPRHLGIVFKVYPSAGDRE